MDTLLRPRAEDLRVPGETIALFIGVALLAFALLVLLRLTLGWILILVLLSIGWVKVRQGQLLGQSVHISEQQFPRVYRAAQRAAERLGMTMPDVFVTQNPVINAYAIGFLGRKSVVLNSATVEAMDEDELTAILGHEFTHIKCAHTHWLVFTQLKDTLRIPLVSDLVGLLLLRWSRKAEYTCDRGGLVACQSLQAACRALAKVAVGRVLFSEMDLDSFFAQRDSLNQDDIARLGERFSTHPYVVNRLYALHGFANSTAYQRWATA